MITKQEIEEIMRAREHDGVVSGATYLGLLYEKAKRLLAERDAMREIAVRQLIATRTKGMSGDFKHLRSQWEQAVDLEAKKILGERDSETDDD